MRRTLGAVWIDNEVARRRNVNLCPQCVSKYKDWWKAHNYHPRWNRPKITDCDGCTGKGFVFCTGFYPAEESSLLRAFH